MQKLYFGFAIALFDHNRLYNRQSYQLVLGISILKE